LAFFTFCPFWGFDWLIGKGFFLPHPFTHVLRGMSRGLSFSFFFFFPLSWTTGCRPWTSGNSSLFFFFFPPSGDWDGEYISECTYILPCFFLLFFPHPLPWAITGFFIHFSLLAPCCSFAANHSISFFPFFPPPPPFPSSLPAGKKMESTAFLPPSLPSPPQPPFLTFLDLPPGNRRIIPPFPPPLPPFFLFLLSRTPLPGSTGQDQKNRTWAPPPFPSFSFPPSLKHDKQLPVTVSPSFFFSFSFFFFADKKCLSSPHGHKKKYRVLFPLPPPPPLRLV